MNAKIYLTKHQDEILSVIRTWENIEDLIVPAKWSLLYILQALFVNDWMSTSLGDRWDVVFRMRGYLESGDFFLGGG